MCYLLIKKRWSACLAVILISFGTSAAQAEICFLPSGTCVESTMAEVECDSSYNLTSKKTGDHWKCDLCGGKYYCYCDSNYTEKNGKCVYDESHDKCPSREYTFTTDIGDGYVCEKCNDKSSAQYGKYKCDDAAKKCKESGYTYVKTDNNTCQEKCPDGDYYKICTCDGYKENAESDKCYNYESCDLGDGKTTYYKQDTSKKTCTNSEYVTANSEIFKDNDNECTLACTEECENDKKYYLCSPKVKCDASKGEYKTKLECEKADTTSGTVTCELDGVTGCYKIAKNNGDDELCPDKGAKFTTHCNAVSGAGKLVCYIRITGANNPNRYVLRVWYHDAGQSDDAIYDIKPNLSTSQQINVKVGTGTPAAGVSKCQIVIDDEQSDTVLETITRPTCDFVGTLNSKCEFSKETPDNTKVEARLWLVRVAKYQCSDYDAIAMTRRGSEEPYLEHRDQNGNVSRVYPTNRPMTLKFDRTEEQYNFTRVTINDVVGPDGERVYCSYILTTKSECASVGICTSDGQYNNDYTYNVACGNNSTRNMASITTSDDYVLIEQCAENCNNSHGGCNNSSGGGGGGGSGNNIISNNVDTY